MINTSDFGSEIGSLSLSVLTMYCEVQTLTFVDLVNFMLFILFTICLSSSPSAEGHFTL